MQTEPLLLPEDFSEATHKKLSAGQKLRYDIFIALLDRTPADSLLRQTDIVYEYIMTGTLPGNQEPSNRCLLQ